MAQVLCQPALCSHPSPEHFFLPKVLTAGALPAVVQARELANEVEALKAMLAKGGGGGGGGRKPRKTVLAKGGGASRWRRRPIAATHTRTWRTGHTPPHTKVHILGSLWGSRHVRQGYVPHPACLAWLTN